MFVRSLLAVLFMAGTSLGLQLTSRGSLSRDFGGRGGPSSLPPLFAAGDGSSSGRRLSSKRMQKLEELQAQEPPADKGFVLAIGDSMNGPLSEYY